MMKALILIILFVVLCLLYSLASSFRLLSRVLHNHFDLSPELETTKAYVSQIEEDLRIAQKEIDRLTKQNKMLDAYSDKAGACIGVYMRYMQLLRERASTEMPER